MRTLIETIRAFLKLLSLSNYDNWELYKARDWSLDMDGYSRPRNFYKHKKYPYFITNAYIKEPLHITDLVNRFINDYNKGKLLMDNCYYIVSK